MLVDVCVKKKQRGVARRSGAPFPRPPGNEGLGVQKGYFDNSIDREGAGGLPVRGRSHSTVGCYGRPPERLVSCVGPDGVWSYGRIRGNPGTWSVPAGAAKRGAAERIPVGELSRLLASHQVDPCTIPGWVTQNFRMWESCRTTPLVGGFSRGSPVPPSFRSGAAAYSPLSPSPALKAPMLKAVQIASLTHSLYFNGRTDNRLRPLMLACRPPYTLVDDCGGLLFSGKAAACVQVLPTFDAQEQRSDKGDSASRIKYFAATMRKALELVQCAHISLRKAYSHDNRSEARARDIKQIELLRLVEEFSSGLLPVVSLTMTRGATVKVRLASRAGSCEERIERREERQAGGKSAIASLGAVKSATGRLDYWTGCCGAASERKGGGKLEIPRENLSKSGIVWHDSRTRKSESDPAGNRTRLTTAGHTHLRILLVAMVRQQKTPHPVLRWPILGPLYNIFGLDYWPVEGVSATAVASPFTASTNCSEALLKSYFQQAHVGSSISAGRRPRGERRLPPLSIALISASHGAIWPNSLTVRGGSRLPEFGNASPDCGCFCPRFLLKCEGVFRRGFTSSPEHARSHAVESRTAIATSRACTGQITVSRNPRYESDTRANCTTPTPISSFVAWRPLSFSMKGHYRERTAVPLPYRHFQQPRNNYSQATRCSIRSSWAFPLRNRIRIARSAVVRAHQQTPGVARSWWGTAGTRSGAPGHSGGFITHGVTPGAKGGERNKIQNPRASRGEKSCFLAADVNDIVKQRREANVPATLSSPSCYFQLFSGDLLKFYFQDIPPPRRNRAQPGVRKRHQKAPHSCTQRKLCLNQQNVRLYMAKQDMHGKRASVLYLGASESENRRFEMVEIDGFQ
ncbi:hypothetical protein PR048_031235 [Dryococelus australis]|uniref:Uncharacterized protein n=1 Tax=Dryococelus australis TaxID=614101 RepID=A0ABQ9G7T3_9NEOP|nr:hypothetical protein PR048_031235 [Dryococelus australis]